MNINEKIELSLRLVREAENLSYDTETSGLDWKTNSPIGYVFHAAGSPSVYIPVRHGGSGNIAGGIPMETATDKITVHPYEIELAKAFAEREKLTTGHNLQFDALFSWNAGVMLGRNLACTQTNQVLIDENTPKFSLDALCKDYGVAAKLGDELYQRIAQQFGVKADRKSMAHFWRLAGNDPVAVEYAEGDGVSTLQLYDAQQPYIAAQELERVVAMESELIWTLVRAERRGLKIDVQYIEGFIAKMQLLADEAAAELPEGLNVRSGVQMRAWMDSLGYSDYPRTEKGNPSFPESWLKTNDAGKTVLKARKSSNVVNTFARPLLTEHNHHGRVHPHINQNRGDEFGTITGRISCSKPNLTAFPKHNKELALPLRRSFIADDGMKMYEADASQGEPRLYAHYSQAVHLIEGYNADPPRDVHTLVAEMMDVDRATTGKRMNMGIFTGMGVKAFAGHLGVNDAVAQDLWGRWFGLFPEIREFQNTAKFAFLKRGYVKTLLGRRARLTDRRFAYKAVSRIIQGGVADIFKYKMVEVDKLFEADGDKAFLQMQIHDSLVWQAPDTPEGEAVSAKAVDIMGDVNGAPFNLRIPFVAEPDMGENWAVSSFGEEACKEALGDNWK
jgi:DNA polymerase I-like protein with 3'-5' exonuclease and polymerase domains